MARYTIELRNVSQLFTEDAVKSWFKDYNIEDYLTAEEVAVIATRGTWSKDRLADKIYNHYYMNEIGFETPALFRHFVKVKMNELMEEYLPLIYSASIAYDPLVNVDYTESYNSASTNASNSNSTSNTTGSGLTINSETPMGQINKTDILAGKYASSTGANENENNITDTSSNTGNGTEQYTKRVKGNSGVSATAQKMVEQYRNNIRAIDREIIEKLADLFMSVY